MAQAISHEMQTNTNYAAHLYKVLVQWFSIDKFSLHAWLDSTKQPHHPLDFGTVHGGKMPDTLEAVMKHNPEM